MKAQTKKSKTTAKVAAKPAKKPAAAPKSQSKEAAKPAARSNAKPVMKPAQAVKVVKTVKVVKPKAKATLAVPTKKTVKPAAKTSVIKKSPVAKPQAKKATVKPSGKLAPKGISRPVPKTAVKVKTALETIATPAKKPATTVAQKSVPKSVTKTLPVVALKAAGKAPKVNPADASLKKALPPATLPPVTAAREAPASNGLPPPPPLKPGRRSSSRAFAHMPPPAPMVPTHAPDAAKASYSTMTERTVAPPPHVAAKKDPKLANNWKTKTGETLTDEEVKAMPDSEYMNEKQLAFFRAKLSVQKQEIHNSAGATTEHLREDTVVVPDPADRATIEEEHALELRTRDRERKLLKKIEQSIGRIDSGDYGYCDETGEPIGVGRLIARPTASLSLEAQQRRELKQKMFGD
mgnify:CR=1 FL=1